jgi:hypothetical protein
MSPKAYSLINGVLVGEIAEREAFGNCQLSWRFFCSLPLSIIVLLVSVNASISWWARKNQIPHVRDTNSGKYSTAV